MRAGRECWTYIVSITKSPLRGSQSAAPGTKSALRGDDDDDNYYYYHRHYYYYYYYYYYY